MAESGGDHVLSWVLSPGASALYAELLAAGAAPAGSLEDAGRGPAVAELLAYGFARLSTDEGRLVVPLPPEVPVVRNFAARAAAWLQAAPDPASMEVDLREIASGRAGAASGAADALIRTVPTGPDLGRALYTLVTSARAEVLTMQSSLGDEETHGSANVEVAPPDLLDRGVTMRYLYDAPVLEDPEFLAAALEEVAGGAEARVIETLPSDFVVADRSTATMTMSFGPRRVVYTEAPAVVAVLVALFESTWQRARPLGHQSWTESTGDLTDDHRMVLSLVVNGLNNEAIARTLKVNPRTVRRRVDDLSLAYGVTSRSSLIAAAVRQADQ